MTSLVTVTRLPANLPPDVDPTAHHVGSPPTSFKNPWPSFRDQSFLNVLRTRFGSDRNFIPVPSSREELVPIRVPDWGAGTAGLKTTWIGHASFLVETSASSGSNRGVRILLDPVFSERTSPFTFLGPKRYTPTPCTLDELPEVDLVVTSHNHYDHTDLATIQELYRKRKGKIHFLTALRNAEWYRNIGIAAQDVTELDWWQGVQVAVEHVGSVRLVCTPSQHVSGRSGLDKMATLWSSWVIAEVPDDGGDRSRKRVFFAGDTGYRALPDDPNAAYDESELPVCPAFRQIGSLHGPFDLALLPIGLFLPRHFMSSMHCAPEDSLLIHKDIASKKSIGMHWGTVRGGLSGQYEDVREPPRRWRKHAESAGYKWGEEIGLMDIGETLIV